MPVTPFLKQVAEHYYRTAENISRLVFVFPNHRAGVFFRKYLAQSVKYGAGRPVLSPVIMSIDEFLGNFSALRQADNLTLVLRLYDCYKECCRSHGLICESLDEFVFWGNVILSDFDDIDKYMINAADLLRNVSDLRELSDDFSYLTENQEKAVRAFLRHFEKEGEYKMKFARLWNILGELYEKFNAVLDSEGLCYGGRMYRSIAEDFARQGAEDMFRSAFPNGDKAVFCGLNVLCECEKKILGAMKTHGLADFCWDYCSDWIKDHHNKSSLFMRENVAAFPGSFTLEPVASTARIEVISVPSGIGQTKIVSQLLADGSVPDDERTAIILPDENLLQPMLNSIPERIKSVNVTMGCSMAGSSFYTLMNDIAALQLRLRLKDGRHYFYHRPFWSIAGNNVFDALLSENARDILKELKNARNYYICPDRLGDDEFLSLVFRPVISDIKSNSPQQLRKIQDYQTDILQYIGRTIASDSELRQRFALELDFAMDYVKAVTLVSQKDLAVLPQTYFALLDNILRTKSVPLKGEPLRGLQIMGPLETRALDFEHIFILNCNEGKFPRAEAGASFIPPMLRSAFGLPSFEYMDAVWAYYFYRMIQRPSKVVLTMDARSEGMRSGEESRYIKQLEYHFGADVTRKTAMASPGSVEDSGIVPKTREHIEKIRSKELSPTALQKYLSCSMKFYFSYVEELYADKEVSENMDAGVIGNVYHKVMQSLYDRRPGGIITRDYLEHLLKDGKTIEDAVGHFTMEEMNSDFIGGRDIVVCAIICKYIKKTLERDIEFMDSERVDSFRIIELEKTYRGEFAGLRFKGTADRVDTFREGVIRLVDYKTGKVLSDDTDINESNAAKIAARIFSRDTEENERPKIALQFFIYNMLLDQAKEPAYEGKTVADLVYSTRTILKEMPKTCYRNSVFRKEMEEQLRLCVEEILNPDVAFERRKEDGYQGNTCKFCDYKTICGR